MEKLHEINYCNNYLLVTGLFKGVEVSDEVREQVSKALVEIASYVSNIEIENRQLSLTLGKLRKEIYTLNNQIDKLKFDLELVDDLD
jgi:predicted nuclease with TOPRIM domain